EQMETEQQRQKDRKSKLHFGLRIAAHELPGERKAEQIQKSKGGGKQSSRHRGHRLAAAACQFVSKPAQRRVGARVYLISFAYGRCRIMGHGGHVAHVRAEPS